MTKRCVFGIFLDSIHQDVIRPTYYNHAVVMRKELAVLIYRFHTSSHRIPHYNEEEGYDPHEDHEAPNCTTSLLIHGDPPTSK